LLVIHFCIEKEKRRNVEEEGERGESEEAQAEICRVNIKGSEGEIDDYI